MRTIAVMAGVGIWLGTTLGPRQIAASDEIPPPANLAETYLKLFQQRQSHLDQLHRYWTQGRFPKNEMVPDVRTPIFVDRHGTHCAVADLIRHSGDSPLVRSVAAADNFVRVLDVKDGPALEWILHSGLTQEECARIQPTYDFRPKPKPLPPTPTEPAPLQIEHAELLKLPMQEKLGYSLRQAHATFAIERECETELRRLVGRADEQVRRKELAESVARKLVNVLTPAQKEMYEQQSRVWLPGGPAEAAETARVKTHLADVERELRAGSRPSLEKALTLLVPRIKDERKVRNLGFAVIAPPHPSCPRATLTVRTAVREPLSVRLTFFDDNGQLIDAKRVAAELIRSEGDVSALRGGTELEMKANFADQSASAQVRYGCLACWVFVEWATNDAALGPAATVEAGF